MTRTETSRLALAVQGAAIAALACLVYVGSLDVPFTFDDWHVIPQNPSVQSLDNIPDYFVDVGHMSILEGNRDYRPLFLTSMALSWWAGDGETRPFHIVSVALHTLCALLLWLILRDVFQRESRDVRAWRSSTPGLAALIAACWFAVHPATTESVSYISAQSVPLAALFYLLSFLLYLRVDAADGASGASRLAAFGSAAAYVLALLAKPIAVTLPLILLLWELVMGRLAGRGDSMLRPREWIDAYVRPLIRLVPHVAITLLYLVARRALFASVAVAGELPRPRVHHYMTQTAALVWYYLRLALWPGGQSVDREYIVVESLLDLRFLGAVLVLAVIAVLLLVDFRRLRLVTFWTLWFPGCLLVTTYLVVLGQVVNEHRLYLSLAGVSAIVGLALAEVAHRLLYGSFFGAYGTVGKRVLTVLLIAAPIAVLGARTVARNALWSSSLLLWEEAALNQGTARATMNYGLALQAEGREAESLVWLQKAYDKRAIAFTAMNLGLGELRAGRAADGLAHLREAVTLWPALPETHFYLGYGLETTGDHEAAVRSYQRALELRPNYVKSLQYLASLYERMQRPDDAIAVYQRLASVQPDAGWVAERIQRVERGRTDDASPVGRAVAAIGAQDYGRAVELLTAARLVTPNDPELMFNLGFAHQRLGQRKESIASYEELLRLQPDHVQGSFNLAYAYMRGDTQDEWSRSVELFLAVLELKPDYAEALFHVASTYWQLGRAESARDYDRRYLESGDNATLVARSRARLAGGPTHDRGR